VLLPRAIRLATRCIVCTVPDQYGKSVPGCSLVPFTGYLDGSNLRSIAQGYHFTGAVITPPSPNLRARPWP